MNRTYTILVPILLILIIAIAEMATAIYTPSLPTVAAHFQISEALTQWTVSINLLGLALSGPIYGPWSDSAGRRTVLRAGMTLFLVGSIFSYLAGTIELLLLARFIQGLGAGVAVVVSFAVVRDLFDEKKSAKVLSFMGMAIALSPGLAPVLGSYIAHHMHWSMCFAVVSMTALGLVILLLTIMPETLSLHERVPLSLKSIGRAYVNVFKNVRFVVLALIPSLMIGSIWAWMAATPVLFIKYLGVPVQHYGYYGFSGVVFYVIGAFMNSKLLNRFDLNSLVMGGLVVCGGSACSLVIAGYSGLEDPMLLQLIEFPFAFGLAFIIPNGTALAFSQVKEGLGASSSLLGSLEMGLGAVGVLLIGTFFDGTITPIASIMLIATLLSWILYWVHRKK
ncbi:MAG: multidrug effflux MFS transporter [Alphaproteobacteria bacterium]|nr:multidrug effflux MFS transporter [Alphaproteobacteria bacterium]